MSKLNSIEDTRSLTELSQNLSISEREEIFRQILLGHDGFYDPSFKDEEETSNRLHLSDNKFQQALRIRKLCYELTDGDDGLDIEDCVSNHLETALKKAQARDDSCYRQSKVMRSQALPSLQQYADEDQDMKKRLTDSIRASVNGKITEDERWGNLCFQALFCQGHVVLWNAPNILAELTHSYLDYDFNEIVHTPDYYALRALRLVNPLILVELKLRGLMKAFTEFVYWRGRSALEEIGKLTMNKHEAMYGIKEDNSKDVQDMIWDHACSWLSAELMQLPKEQYFSYNPNWQKLCSRHAAMLREGIEQNVLKALYVIAEREEDFKKTWDYLRKNTLTGFYADENYDYWFRLQSALDPNKYYFLPTISKCVSIHKQYASVLKAEFLLEKCMR